MISMYKGHIKIRSNREKKDDVLSPYHITVELDGKKVPFLQKVEVLIDITGVPIVRMEIIPDKLLVDLEGIEFEVKDNGI